MVELQAHHSVVMRSLERQIKDEERISRLESQLEASVKQAELLRQDLNATRQKVDHQSNVLSDYRTSVNLMTWLMNLQGLPAQNQPPAAAVPAETSSSLPQTINPAQLHQGQTSNTVLPHHTSNITPIVNPSVSGHPSSSTVTGLNPVLESPANDGDWALEPFINFQDQYVGTYNGQNQSTGGLSMPYLPQESSNGNFGGFGSGYHGMTYGNGTSQFTPSSQSTATSVSEQWHPTGGKTGKQPTLTNNRGGTAERPFRNSDLNDSTASSDRSGPSHKVSAGIFANILPAAGRAALQGGNEVEDSPSPSSSRNPMDVRFAVSKLRSTAYDSPGKE
jgi:hypothetical protein